MNEDSVVSSLNELRRMANERSRREGEARARLEAERRAWEDRNRSGRHGETRSRAAEGRPDPKAAPHTMTYGFPEATIQVEGHDPVGQWQPSPGHTQTLSSAPSPQQQINESQTSRMSAAEWAAREAPAAAPAAQVRQKSQFGWVLFTVVVLGLAGAAGYVQLNNQHKLTLDAERDINRKLEEAKNQAVEAAARAEAQLKAQASSYDNRIKMLTAARAAPMVAGDARPAAAARIEAPKGADAMAAKPARGRSRRWSRAHGSGWSKRGAAPAAAVMNADDKKPVLPRIARKKKLTDDPLDGLKL